MAFDWVVPRGEDGFEKNGLKYFWVIHVSAAAGEAEETAACMYIHYCGLGMVKEIMCFSSSYSYTAVLGGLWVFAETSEQEFCVTKSSLNMNLCIFDGLLLKDLKNSLLEIEAVAPEFSKIWFISPSVHFLLGSFLLKRLIRDIAFNISDLVPVRKLRNKLSSEQRPCRPRK